SRRSPLRRPAEAATRVPASIRSGAAEAASLRMRRYRVDKLRSVIEFTVSQLAQTGFESIQPARNQFSRRFGRGSDHIGNLLQGKPLQVQGDRQAPAFGNLRQTPLQAAHALDIR